MNRHDSLRHREPPLGMHSITCRRAVLITGGGAMLGVTPEPAIELGAVSDNLKLCCPDLSEAQVIL